MCNLFENTVSFADLVRAFGLFRTPIQQPGPEATPNWPPFTAVRPTDPAPVVRAMDGGGALGLMRWGFRAERPKAPPVTNFRSEDRRFANGGDRGRALIPATAFFEYTGDRSPKTRWRFTEAQQPWLCLAGLWRRYEDGDRFTLLTTAPGPDMAPYHDRQVVVMPREAWADWLGGAGGETELLQPSPAGTLQAMRDSPQPPPLPLFGAAP
jgi:putative SOS response-associated peptidase YedK